MTMDHVMFLIRNLVYRCMYFSNIASEDFNVFVLFRASIVVPCGELGPGWLGNRLVGTGGTGGGSHFLDLQDNE